MLPQQPVRAQRKNSTQLHGKQSLNMYSIDAKHISFFTNTIFTPKLVFIGVLLMGSSLKLISYPPNATWKFAFSVFSVLQKNKKTGNITKQQITYLIRLSLKACFENDSISYVFNVFFCRWWEMGLGCPCSSQIPVRIMSTTHYDTCESESFQAYCSFHGYSSEIP